MKKAVWVGVAMVILVALLMLYLTWAIPYVFGR
jgi:hypothetical protein